jgi:hypothetical protein
MKKIIIALALVGLSWSGAEAQTKTTSKTCKCVSTTKAKKAKVGDAAHLHRHPGSKTTKSGDAYQVCVKKDGYYQCCEHHKAVTKVVAQ